jgi:hypothetical protein
MARRRRGWTVDTLHEHLDMRLAEKDRRDQQRFDAQTQAITAALQAAKEAVDKAEMATERRFESVNEFRGQLADLVARLLPRSEYESAHRSLTEKISDLSTRLDKSEARSAGGWTLWAYIAGGIGLVAAIVALIIK